MEERKIKNKAKVEFENCEEKITIESNETEAKPVNIKIEKKQNCDKVSVGKNLKYTVLIKNECNAEVEDLLFEDNFDECTDFVPGSFKVNGVTKTPEVNGHTLKFEIEKLEPCETLTITFEVKVTEKCCECKCKDKSETPYVKQIKNNDTKVTGTGVPNATIFVTFPNNEIGSGMVAGNGNWSIDTPDKKKFTDGDTVKIVQVEPGKCESDKVVVVVGK